MHIIFFVGLECMINSKSLGGYHRYSTRHSLSKSPLTILLQDSQSTILYISPSALRGQPLWDYAPLPEASTVSLYFNSNFYPSQSHGTYSILLIPIIDVLPFAKQWNCLHGILVFWHGAVNTQHIQEVFGKMLACWCWRDETSTQARWCYNYRILDFNKTCPHPISIQLSQKSLIFRCWTVQCEKSPTNWAERESELAQSSNKD